ncbi:acyl-CoA dehydrogenase [Natrinema sp. SYSU A 869]|uniref:acyl-CoA dehydrogenase n=1 Tax=Natrinema sp. SYSU A 869 TaxID=2871694 RepID=UPI0021039DC3|nr:acyl-CoA dehydrogenase [Natrinema sp. SYSU A 869]
MKDGAGDLDFGQSDDTEETTDSGSPDDSSSNDGQQNQDQPHSSETSANQTAEQSTSQSVSTNEPESEDHKYPYFVRRSKVLDERDERIEAHLRKEVTDQESDFRSALADELETNNDIPKSDAREFALKYASKIQKVLLS